MRDDKFIFVKDEKTKCNLEKSGFRLLRKSGNYWIFLNDKSKQFACNDNVVFSSTLVF